ncbi:hypothetical protein DBR40_05175 [Pedobacter sp. KBW01]|uniref:tyrosine-type recombinase/integrase n=1 Tax=Pedobacter sp. KBW01 TaxID=2153364 RepID=UPI000F5B65DA|nr:tyrosine-type recombinase/integrase [Pedobacter sp. KBW01]RQO79112.1 hypothetical protein DBR40_05175 [Pedobacter sp. KBW01]
MKASVRLHLYTSKTYKDNCHPIVLQYIINGKVKRKVVARCQRDDWDQRNNKLKTKAKNSPRINAFLSDAFAKAERELYDVKEGLKTISEIFREEDSITLNDAMKLELKRMQEEFKSGYYDKILALQRQIKNKDIPIDQVDEKWFAKLISEQEAAGNMGSTIMRKIKLIRGLILRYSTKGVTKEVKAVRVVQNKSVKQKLNTLEMEALAKLDLPEEDLLRATRDLFLLQVYLRGVRVGDLLQAYAKDFVNGRYEYTADKTDKKQTIKLIPQAQAIVDHYSGKYERLFPFFTWKPAKGISAFNNDRARLKHKETCTTAINKYLKVLAVMAGIQKPLTSHIARHTFARMAIDKINNPMVTMELLGHSSLAVHQAYLNDIRKDDELDAAADDIFS